MKLSNTNSKANFEIMLVFVIIVTGVAVATIAALRSKDNRQLFALASDDHDFDLEPKSGGFLNSPVQSDSTGAPPAPATDSAQRAASTPNASTGEGSYKRARKQPTPSPQRPSSAESELGDDVLLSSLVDVHEPLATEHTPTTTLETAQPPPVQRKRRLKSPYASNEPSAESAAADASVADSWQQQSQKPRRPTTPTIVLPAMSLARPTTDGRQTFNKGGDVYSVVDEISADNVSFGVDEDLPTGGKQAPELQLLRLVNRTSGQRSGNPPVVASSELLSHLIGVTPLVLEPVTQPSSSKLMAQAGDKQQQSYRGIFSPQSSIASSFLYDLLRLLRPNSAAHSHTDIDDKHRLGLLQQLRVMPTARLLSLSGSGKGNVGALVEPRSAGDESNAYYQRVAFPEPLPSDVQALLASVERLNRVPPFRASAHQDSALPAFEPPRGTPLALLAPDEGGDSSAEEAAAKDADFVANVAGFVRHSGEAAEQPSQLPRKPQQSAKQRGPVALGYKPSAQLASEPVVGELRRARRSLSSNDRRHADIDADSTLPLSVVQLDGRPTGGGRVLRRQRVESAHAQNQERAAASSDLMSKLLGASASVDELSRDDDERDEIDDDEQPAKTHNSLDADLDADAMLQQPVGEAAGDTTAGSELLRRRKLNQQQRADVAFYGHPGEETRELKYGILGSGNYEVVNGGTYQDSGSGGGGDESSAAAVNSVANYMRSGAGNVEQQAILGQLPKLLDGYALALNGLEPPQRQITPLLELLDASAMGGPAGKSHFLTDAVGSSKRSTFATGDEEPRAPAKSKQHRPAPSVFGFQGYDDFGKKASAGKASGRQRHLASTAALQQQQSLNKVTIFSDTDLDSLPSERQISAQSLDDGEFGARLNSHLSSEQQ